jgi:steroid delta-isomerase-like uncharacterized protein
MPDSHDETTPLDILCGYGEAPLSPDVLAHVVPALERPLAEVVELPGTDAASRRRRERNEQVVRRLFEDAVNGRDLDLVYELYAEDVVDHDALPGAPAGVEGVRHTLAGLIAAFPDLEITVEDVSSHGDMVVVHNTWAGTRSGKLLGLPATGTRAEFSSIVIFRLEGGRIAERWAMLDGRAWGFGAREGRTTR